MGRPDSQLTPAWTADTALGVRGGGGGGAAFQSRVALRRKDQGGVSALDTRYWILDAGSLMVGLVRVTVWRLSGLGGRWNAGKLKGDGEMSGGGGLTEMG